MFIQENLSEMKHETISDNFKEIFEGKQFSKETSPLTKANDAYNNLVNKGLLKKRGYTLRGIEDAHLFRMKFNGDLLNHKSNTCINYISG